MSSVSLYEQHHIRAVLKPLFIFLECMKLILIGSVTSEIVDFIHFLALGVKSHSKVSKGST